MWIKITSFPSPSISRQDEMQVILLPLEFTVQFHFYFLSVPLSLDKPPDGGSALVQILHWSFAEAASSWIQSWQIQQQQAGDASKQGELGHSAAPKWLPCRLSQLFITASASLELLWKGNKFYHRFGEQGRREKNHFCHIRYPWEDLKSSQPSEISLLD